MTQDEIIEMAREAGIMSSVLNHWPLELKKFVNLAAAKAAAKEREACAKVCDEASDKALAMQSGSADDLGNVILRHHAVAHQNDAEAIRARGNT